VAGSMSGSVLGKGCGKWSVSGFVHCTRYCWECRWLAGKLEVTGDVCWYVALLEVVAGHPHNYLRLMPHSVNIQHVLFSLCRHHET